MTPFAAVSQTDLEMELVDIAGKDIWVSKFIHLTADFEAGAHQKAILTQNHKWSDVENLLKLGKLVFETWNAFSTQSKHLESCQFSDTHTYVSRSSRT